MAYLVICFSFGLAAGFVGKMKGSSFVIWFFIGAVLPVIGLVCALLYRYERDELRRQCPTCSALVMLYDQVCVRCGTDLEFPETAVAPESAGRP